MYIYYTNRYMLAILDTYLFITIEQTTGITLPNNFNLDVFYSGYLKKLSTNFVLFTKNIKFVDTTANYYNIF